MKTTISIGLFNLIAGAIAAACLLTAVQHIAVKLFSF